MMDHCSRETLAEEPEDVDVDIQDPPYDPRLVHA
jgi:hypothetical protein